MDKKEIMSVWAAFQEVQEKKKMDPVGKADGDIDNDGDEDESDEYLANRRKKIGAAMKKEGKVPPQFAKKGEKEDEKSDEKSEKEDDEKSDKPKKGENPFAKKKEVEEWVGKEGARRVSGGDKRKDKVADKELEEKQVKEEDKEECPKCEGEGCDHCDGKGYHSVEKETYGKKMKESNLFSADELAAIEEKASAEEFMSTSSAGEKKFYGDHKKSDKKFEDWEEVGEMDASKAGKAVKSQSPKRGGEDRQSEPMGKVKGS